MLHKEVTVNINLITTHRNFLLNRKQEKVDKDTSDRINDRYGCRY